jgi:superfamily II DNA or RNA helicase
MGRALRPAALAEVRALIARELLGAEAGEERLGSITLQPHQRDAAARLRTTMDEFGGALLADDVGLGKTYVAAAIIRGAPRALVVAPASLRDMWRRALAACDARAEIISYSALSRGRMPDTVPGLLVLDEAHHARTPGARRYATIARLAAGARVLALSATPVHNSRDDLAAVLALFLGARAWAMRDDALARCVVRREHGDLDALALPTLEAPRWLPVGDDARLLDAILDLAPAVPPSGGGDGGALIAWGLVRQWASSRAALEGALRRRLARAVALGAALEEGRYPSERELASWSAAEGVVQLGFASLLAPVHAESAPLLHTVRAHEGAVRSLLGTIRRDNAMDAARAAQLDALREQHAGERIVAFSQFADTVHALYRHLAPRGGVAALTARGARIAGGVITRRDALARFAPRASGAAPPRAAERIDLLLATDVLSEGLDLSDASVVVHLDLPWTPARMEQRVGRSRRMGATHARTAVYALSPPAAAETLLEVERRLRTKLAAAGRVTGIAGAILPSLGPSPNAPPSAARTRELLHRAIAAWRRSDQPRTGDPLIARAAGERDALIVLVREAGSPALAASVDGAELGDEPALLLEAVRLAEQAAPTPLECAVADRAFAAVERWLTRRSAAAAAGGATPLFRAASRRAALHRIAVIAHRAPHHRRALLSPLCASARRTVTTPFGLGAERILETLASAPLADEAWLRALGEFGAIHAGASRPPREDAGGPDILAMILIARV